MPRWYRHALVVWLGLAMPLAFAACAGKSSNESGGEGGHGGSSGTAGTPSSGGSKAGGCSYNGVHYERGQTFGECNECACDDQAGVACKLIGCVPGTGGISGSTGGASGTSPGCEFERKHFDEGASWPVDCNTCYCKESSVVCTEKACSSGTGGSGASSGGAGRGGFAGAGEAGAGGASSSCSYAPIGSFCVVGNPSGGGQGLLEGMPLTVSMRPAGCYSSSCTQLVSADCNYIGSNGIYWVSGFVCLATEGNACTDDCGGGGNPVCQPGVTLTAGDYTVGIGGTSLTVKFSVPSHVAANALCASTGEL